MTRLLRILAFLTFAISAAVAQQPPLNDVQIGQGTGALPQWEDLSTWFDSRLGTTTCSMPVRTTQGAWQALVTAYNVECFNILPGNSAATNSTNFAALLAAHPKSAFVFPNIGYAFNTGFLLTESQSIVCATHGNPTTGANLVQVTTSSTLFFVRGSSVRIANCTMSIAGVPTGAATAIIIGDDAQQVTTGNVITSGNATITCTSCTFTSADVGKQFTCLNCMAGPTNQSNGTITAFVDANHVTISPTPTASVTNTTISWGFDYQFDYIQSDFLYNWSRAVVIVSAANFLIDDTFMEASDPLIIQNLIWGDQGDGKLSNNWIVANLAGAHQVFQYLSGGGLIAPGNKFLSLAAITACINVFWTGNVSSLGPWIDGGSIEGGCTSGVLVNTNGPSMADDGRLIGTEITIANGGVCVNLQPSVPHHAWVVADIQCFETGAAANGIFAANMAQIILGPNNIKNNDGSVGGVGVNIQSTTTGDLYVTQTDVTNPVLNASPNLTIHDLAGLPFASLPTAAQNGSQIFVTNGLAGSTPCVSGGTGGALATRINGVWACAGTQNQGTWTPALAGSTGAGTPTYTIQAGFYEQNARLVTVRFVITVTALGGPTGNMTITGLPVANANVTNAIGMCTITYMSGVTLDTSFTTLTGVILPNNSTILLFELGSGQTGAQTPVAKFAAATTLEGSCNYQSQ